MCMFLVLQIMFCHFFLQCELTHFTAFNARFYTDPFETVHMLMCVCSGERGGGGGGKY